mgnify:CR=1 FL=1
MLLHDIKKSTNKWKECWYQSNTAQSQNYLSKKIAQSTLRQIPMWVSFLFFLLRNHTLGTRIRFHKPFFAENIIKCRWIFHIPTPFLVSFFEWIKKEKNWGHVVVKNMSNKMIDHHTKEVILFRRRKGIQLLDFNQDNFPIWGFGRFSIPENTNSMSKTIAYAYSTSDPNTKH